MRSTIILVVILINKQRKILKLTDSMILTLEREWLSKMHQLVSQKCIRVGD